MIKNLIDAKINKADYEVEREKFISFLEDKHKQLVKYAARKDAKEFVVTTGNKELEVCYQFLNAAENAITNIHSSVKQSYIHKEIIKLGGYR
jgi:hypothetical protein